MRLVYLSPVPWASFAQRPHKFVEWFQRRGGGQVLWIDPYPTRLPILTDLVRSKPKAGPVRDETPCWLTVLRPRALPMEPLPGSGRINRVLWRELLDSVMAFVAQGPCQIAAGKPSELALQILKRFPGMPSVYDAMDDFPAFYSGFSRRAMERREQELSNGVSRILVSSTELRSRLARHGDKLTTVRNACAVDSLPPVDSLRPLPSRPILGYVGTIGHWFDWPLVIEIARQNPTVVVRLVGPIYVPARGSLPENIELLPACSHSEAIQAMLRFSAGLIPFKKTDLTASVDPIKYYEYRALGVTVVSTSFGEMALRHDEPGVFFADEATDLGRVAEMAVGHRYEKEQIQAFREANGWDARFDASGILG